MGVNRSFHWLIFGLLFGVGLTRFQFHSFNFLVGFRIRSYIVRIPPFGESLPVKANMSRLNCSLTAHVTDSQIHAVKLSVLLKDGAQATSVKITNSKTGQNIPTQLINQTTFDFTTSGSGNEYMNEYEIFIPFQLFLPVHEPSITLVKDSFGLRMLAGFQFYTPYVTTFIIGRDLNQTYRIVSDVERIETETENLNNSNLGENTKLVWDHYKLDTYNHRIKASEFSEYSLQLGERAHGKSVTVLMEKSLHKKTLPYSNWLLQNTAETAEALIHYYKGIFNTPVPMTLTEIVLLFSDDEVYTVFANNYYVIHLARSDLSMDNRTDLELGIAFEMSHCLVDPWIRTFTNSKSGRTWLSKNMCAGLKSHIASDWAYEYLRSLKNTSWVLGTRNSLRKDSQYIFQALELMLSRKFVQDALKPLLHAAATPNVAECNEASLLKALDDHVLKQNAQGRLPEGKILISEIVKGLQNDELIRSSGIRIDSLESLSDNSQLSICVYNTNGKNFWLPIKIDFVTGKVNDSTSKTISSKLWVNPQHGCYELPLPEPDSLQFLTVSCGEHCLVPIKYLSNILTRLVTHAEFLSTDQKLKLMYHQYQIMRSPKLRTDPTDTINALELTKICKGSDVLKVCNPLVLHLILKISYQITFAQDYKHKLVFDYFSPLMESAVISSGGIETILKSDFFLVCVMLQIPVCTEYVAKVVQMWVAHQNEDVFLNLYSGGPSSEENVIFWKCTAIRLEDTGNKIWNFFYEKFMETVQNPVNNSYKVKEYLRILGCTKNDYQFLQLLRIVLDLDAKGQFGSITNTAALFQHTRKRSGPDLYSLSDARMKNVLSFAEISLSEEESGTKNIHEFMLIAETILSEDTGLFHCRVGSSEWKIWFNRFQSLLERNKTGKNLKLGDFRNSTCDDDDYWYTDLQWWLNNKNATLEWLRQNTILGASSSSKESSALPNSYHHHYYYYAILGFVVLCFIVIVLAFVWKLRMSSEDNSLRMPVNRNNLILGMETEE